MYGAEFKLGLGPEGLGKGLSTLIPFFMLENSLSGITLVMLLFSSRMTIGLLSEKNAGATAGHWELMDSALL